jgi:hypothetical protein
MSDSEASEDDCFKISEDEEFSMSDKEEKEVIIQLFTMN